MPLRAIGNGKDYISYELAPEEWTALKGSYRSMGLRMPCCDNSAIPKTSKLGTQFFSHARRGDCTSGPETPEHLLGKSIIAMAAQSVGWKVTPEFRGTGSRGESWIASGKSACNTP
jgi:competence protein CoiA